MPLSIEFLASLVGEPDSSVLLETIAKEAGLAPGFSRIEQLGFLEWPPFGLSVALKDDLYLETRGQSFRREGPMSVDAIHLYSDGYESYSAYRGSLPGGIHFDDSREAVQRKLGLPRASGGGNVAVGRTWPPWDRFDFDWGACRVQYNPDLERIDMVTIMGHQYPA